MPNKNVSLPDGRVVSFPDNMSDDDISSAIKRDLSAPSPQPQSQAQSNFIPNQFNPGHPLDNIKSNMPTLGNVIQGAGKGLLSTLSMGHDWAAQHLPRILTTPIGQAPTVENQQRGTDALNSATTPSNAAQKLGFGTEQAAEFLAPTGIETGLANFAKATKLGTAANVGLKMLGAGLHSGAVNAAQGGSFAGGAAAGMSGNGLAQGLSALAPALAETALKVRGVDRSYGATPGRAILDQTSGFSPRAVVDSARNSLSDVHVQQGNVLAGSPDTVSLTPTRGIAGDYLRRALEENHPGTVKDIGKIGDQLNFNVAADGGFDANGSIPDDVTASKAAALNRGISSAKTSWNPATASDTMNAAAGQMHHQLAGDIATVVPEIRPLNQQVQSLMPVVQRGTAADLNAGLLQRVAGRIGAATGALSSGIAGYHLGGIPGAAIGLIGPEALTNPSTIMGAARLFNSPTLNRVGIPAATAVGLQATRQKNEAIGVGMQGAIPDAVPAIPVPSLTDQSVVQPNAARGIQAVRLQVLRNPFS